MSAPSTPPTDRSPRGIASLDVLTAAARPYYLFAKYNPDIVDLRI